MNSDHDPQPTFSPRPDHLHQPPVVDDAVAEDAAAGEHPPGSQAADETSALDGATSAHATTEGDQPSAEAGKITRFRIGSQRWPEKNPAAKPKPATEFLASPRPRAVQPPAVESQPAEILSAAGSTPAAPPAGVVPPSPLPAEMAAAAGAPLAAASSPAETVSASVVAAAQHEAPAAHASMPSSGAASAERKPEGDSRRERRDRRSKSDKVPLVEPTASRKVQPPNVRAQLTPELEQELAAALGDLPVEALLVGDSAQSAAGGELEPESRHRARIVMVHRDDVFLDLGGRRQGILSARSFVEPPEAGAVVEVIVSRFDPAEGLYTVTLPGGAVHVEDWSQVSEGMVVEARVTGHNKGGLECEVSQLRGFIPASQMSLYRVEDMSQFVGQKFACVVTEANPDKRNLVLSRRAVLEREKAESKANLLATLEVGQLREAVVRSLQEFGAFVDLGGIDGLIHISQLSWDRIRHASEVLEVGQKVKVKIQKIDPETGKIGLAFRDLAENPWSGAAQKYAPRSKVQGTVSRITEFGAFVRLEAGIEGLIHISELAHKRVFRAGDIVQEGQTVEVLVLSVDAEQQRIGLSLKALEARPTPVGKDKEPEPAEPEPPLKVPAKRKVPLKGGIGQASGGEKFGLKW
jgi:predicted RNA-binding protein with RPS1 domain